MMMKIKLLVKLLNGCVLDGELCCVCLGWVLSNNGQDKQVVCEVVCGFVHVAFKSHTCVATCDMVCLCCGLTGLSFTGEQDERVCIGQVGETGTLLFTTRSLNREGELCHF